MSMTITSRDHCERDRYGLGAFVIYLALAMIFFARGLGHLSGAYIGTRADPGVFIWSLAWLPHALSSGLNPVVCPALWAPLGVSLAWMTWMPLGGLVASPLTLTLGPVVSYNVLSLLALPTAAWAAFVLCRYISRLWSASLVGGYLFGFSGYMCFYLWNGDLSLLAVFPIPLLVYAVLRAFDGEISPRGLVGRLTFLLFTLFGFFTELFATATMFGAIAIVAALILLPGIKRDRLRALLPSIVLSYVLALIVLSPYLYYIFLGPLPKAPMWPPWLYAGDLLFFLLPSCTSALAQVGFVRGLIDSLPNTAYVGYSYVGPIMLAVVAVFTWRNWRAPAVRLLVTMFFIVAILSLGFRLTVRGRALAPMPGMLLATLPLLGSALTVRFTLYLALVLALVMTLWLSGSDTNLYAKSIVAALAVIFVLPNQSSGYWNTPVDTPRFFASGAYRRYLTLGEIALVVPYGWTGNSMLWQAQTDMYFRLPGAWTGPPPAEFERWPAMVALFNGNYLPEPELQLKAFLASHQVTAVLVDVRARDSSDPRRREEYRTVLTALGPPAAEDGGMLIYRFTPDSLATWRGLNPLDLERRADAARFAALLGAVERYLHASGEPALLNTAQLEKMGLIRDNWVGGPNIRISNGLWVHTNSDGTFDVGTYGSRGALAALITKYRPDALRVNTIAVATSESAGGETELELMVMTFDRRGLERAAALARADSNLGSIPQARERTGTPTHGAR